MASDGSGEPQRLTESDLLQRVSSWSPDGVLAFVQDAADIWTVRWMAVVSLNPSRYSRHRAVGSVFTGRTLAGLRVGRDGSIRSLRAAVSEWRASPANIDGWR